MITKTNPRVATWLALAMGIAAGTSLEAAIVQFTLDTVLTKNSPSYQYLDVTGDGVGDKVMLGHNGTSSWNLTLYGVGDASVGLYQVGDIEWLGGALTSSWIGGEVSFNDVGINGGATTYGRLEGSTFYSEAEDSGAFSFSRIVFNTDSTAAPTGDLAASYDEYVPTSAVPEASTSLGLLALGAGGILTRRRTKRAA